MGFEIDRRMAVRKFGDKKPVRQKTLKNPIGCSGIALHSGEKVSLTLRPAAANSGIVFHRTDIAGAGAVIPARWDHVVDTRLCTMLGDGMGRNIGTVEHLMSALAGSGIDNATIEVSGPEIPVMDGSADPFLFLIECAGTVEQNAYRRVVRVLKPVSVVEEGRSATLRPGRGFSVGFEISFKSAAISRQTLSFGIDGATFRDELSRARTFGFLEDVQNLWRMGLARGGSLDNAVVIQGDRVLNEGGLRYEDEFVRHKMLDAVGDLYLAGAPIMGHFHGVCSGHETTNKLLAALFADKSAWTYDVMTAGDAQAPMTPVVALPAVAVGA